MEVRRREGEEARPAPGRHLQGPGGPPGSAAIRDSVAVSVSREQSWNRPPHHASALGGGRRRPPGRRSRGRCRARARFATITPGGSGARALDRRVSSSQRASAAASLPRDRKGPARARAMGANGGQLGGSGSRPPFLFMDWPDERARRRSDPRPTRPRRPRQRLPPLRPSPPPGRRIRSAEGAQALPRHDSRRRCQKVGRLQSNNRSRLPRWRIRQCRVARAHDGWGRSGCTWRRISAVAASRCASGGELRFAEREAIERGAERRRPPLDRRRPRGPRSSKQLGGLSQ
jgi:hypothetical protein